MVLTESPRRLTWFYADLCSIRPGLHIVKLATGLQWPQGSVNPGFMGVVLVFPEGCYADWPDRIA